MTRKQAKNFIADLIKLRNGVDDALASLAVWVYPELAYDGKLIPTGTRINWNGILKRAAADLWDTKENDPEHAPDLWEDIPYRDGIRIIPDVITVGTAFALGELGWWGDELYESKLEANVWTPAENPDGWVKTGGERT